MRLLARQHPEQQSHRGVAQPLPSLSPSLSNLTIFHSSALQDRSLVRACVRANTSTGTRAAAVNGLYCRQELAMTQWSFVCAIFPVVLKGGVDRPVSVQRRQGEPGTAGYTARRAFVSLKPGSLKRRSVSVRGLTGDHGKTDGYDVPDAYDATTPIFRRSTAAVEGKGMTGSTAPGGCRLSVEGGGQPATNPNLEKQAHRSTGGTHDVVHARDPFTVRQGTTLMTTLMRTNRTAVGPARRRYSTIQGGV